MNLYTILTKSTKEHKTHHYAGDLTNYKLLPVPEILIIEEDTEETSGFFLYRYSMKGDFCGDTWHPNIQEAKEQAVFEYGDSLKEWKKIPSDIKDCLDYILELLKKN